MFKNKVKSCPELQEWEQVGYAIQGPFLAHQLYQTNRLIVNETENFPFLWKLTYVFFQGRISGIIMF